MFLCALCQRQLSSTLIKFRYQRLWQNVQFHTHPGLFYRPKLNEREERLEGVKFDVEKIPPRETIVTIEDEDAIKERYQTQLQVEDWREQKISLMQLPGIYMKLSKSNLTGLVVLTTLMGYSIASGPLQLEPLLWTVVGTGLCSAGANSINQWIEVPFDCQMARTRGRVLVRGVISSTHAMTFGITTGVAGTALLATMVNPLTALLGAANILLYAAIYTPLKRFSIANTWVGSLVGAIPPLMGWVACTGHLDAGAFVLAGLLYAWQFFHFNSLSWGLRADYSRGGYQMAAVTDPDLCRRVALRYSLAMVPICVLGPVLGVTSWWFALDSLPLNVWLAYLGWSFYRDADFKSSRRLFHFSLFYLPLLMGLMLINKKSHASSTEGRDVAGTVK
ncbi:hypothetical protein EMCRGX_G027690 [Ephydatia muelleri]|eukprot:Em0020g886a